MFGTRTSFVIHKGNKCQCNIDLYLYYKKYHFLACDVARASVIYRHFSFMIKQIYIQPRVPGQLQMQMKVLSPYWHAALLGQSNTLSLSIHSMLLISSAMNMLIDKNIKDNWMQSHSPCSCGQLVAVHALRPLASSRQNNESKKLIKTASFVWNSMEFRKCNYCKFIDP